MAVRRSGVVVIQASTPQSQTLGVVDRLQRYAGGDGLVGNQHLDSPPSTARYGGTKARPKPRPRVGLRRAW